MEYLSSVLSGLTLLLLTIGGFVLMLTRRGLIAGVDSGVKAAVANAVDNINWPNELTQALERARGVERQELRYKSYGELWARLRPLARYGTEPISRETVRELSKALSDWYFSPCGGLLLTRQTRSFYFAIQDLLQEVSNSAEDWVVQPSEDEPRRVFRKLLEKKGLHQAIAVQDYLDERAFGEWEKTGDRYGSDWRTDVQKLARSWQDMEEKERYWTLQQVGSVLRTSLTNDVESRII